MADTLSRQVDIAIVGGGIAGLAAAAALSQQGLSLLLIESRPCRRPWKPAMTRCMALIRASVP
jgi:2-polyprenyl-6-methoxyphenol hydroxylase-like FAD-dependent oxidoreductase